MTVKIGLVGTGEWARGAHIPALKALGADLVGCVSGSIDEAQGAADELGFTEAFETVTDLLTAQPELSALVVAAPDDVHASAAQAALEAGVAVYCEKPLANDASTAVDLMHIAARTQAIATVGYSFRYSQALQRLRSEIAEGRFGRSWLIELWEHNPQFHPRGGKPMNWKGDPKHSASGALFEYGSHVVDLAEWLIGPLASVATAFGYVRADAKLDDVSVLQLRFENGALGNLVASWVLPGSFPGIRIMVHGSLGSVEVRLDDTVPNGESYRAIAPDGTLSAPAPSVPLELGRATYAARHLADFLALVDGRAPRFPDTLPTFVDGARVQTVLAAAVEAVDIRVHLKDSTSSPKQHLEKA